MGSKGGTSSTTNQSSSSSPPPQVMAEYQALVNRATDNANQSYQQYPGELVAPLSGQTTAGLGQTSTAANTAQPFMNAAAGATMAAATPVEPTAFSPGQVNQYLNPYTQDVVDTTQQQFNNQNEQSAQFLNSQNISSGAFGGDRAGVSQAILANQQQTAQAPVIAGLYNQNYNQALSEFNTQQGVGLQAQAFNNQQLGQMGNQLANIGTADQSAGLQGAMAQIQAGMIPQQEQQQIDTSLYNQYLQQQSYPFQTTGWLGNIVEGTGSLSGGTSQGTSTTSSQQGSPISSGIGAALSGIGILGSLSDARSKDNVHPVGKTFDGQTIYRFNYKGDPRTQVGLIAQETEHHHPFAVHRRGDGMRTVDYDEATRASAERGHFAFGGAPQQQNMDTLPSVGQQAMVMGALGDQGAKSGMGNIGLMASSPTTALASARPGFATGGSDGTIDALNDLNSPLINGQLNPLAGVANDTFDDASGGTANPQFGVDFSVPNAIGKGPADLATPMTQIPGPGQNYPALDWQNPGNDFQTAGAEASLQGLEARPGVETSPSESNPAASSLTSAAGQGGSGAGGVGLGGIAGNSNLSNNLGAWASGNPVAFGGNPAPGVSTALPGTMPGVSVGQRMAPISAALGNGPTMGGGTLGAPAGGAGGAGGAGVIQGARPPQASATPAPTPAAAKPAMQSSGNPVMDQLAGWQALSSPQMFKAGDTYGDPYLNQITNQPNQTPHWTGGRIGRDVGGGVPYGMFDPTLPPLSTQAAAPPTAAQVGAGFGAARPGIPSPAYDGTALGTWTPSGGATPAGGSWAPAGNSEIALPTGGPGQTSQGVGGPIKTLGTTPAQGTGMARGGAARVYRAAGGMLGQSGMGAALQQPPQQAMVTGQNPANQPGFNNMFGGSGGMRPTFAVGGGADMSANPAIGADPFQQVETWVPTVANTVMGHGPPQPGAMGGGGGGGGGQPSSGAPDLGKAGAGLKKLFDKAGQGASATPATPAAPAATPPSVVSGQGGTGSDAVAGGTAGDMPTPTPDFSALDDTTFDLGGLGGLARGGRVRKRGHFASGGADYTIADSVAQNDDPDLPSMKNDPEVGGVIPPMPARVATKTPDAALAAETAPPADQGPPPRAVDDAKAASIVGSEAPPSQFDRNSALGQPPVTGAPNASSVPGAPSVMSDKQAAQFVMGQPPAGVGRGIQMPVGSPAPAVPPPRPQIAPPAGQPPTAPPQNAAPSAALARARQGQPGQPGGAAPAYAPGQAVPQAPAVGALGAVRPGGNLNPQVPSPPTGGFMNSMAQIESNNQNIPSGVDKDYPGQPGSKSQGYLQIDTPTWRQFAANVPGAAQYPNAMSAPRNVQMAVGAQIPLARFGSRTQAMIQQQYGQLDKTQTLGALAAAHGDSGQGVQVAQAGASDYDPNAALAHLNNGQPYFTAKDYADANSSKRPLFNAMMQAGFAMMGGESRNPMINIGRGAMAGMEYYQKQQNLDREWIGTQATIDHLGHEDRRLDVQTQLEAQKMQIEMMKIRSAIDFSKGMSDLDSGGGGGSGAPAAAPSPPPKSPAPQPINAGIGAPGAGASPVQIAGQPGQGFAIPGQSSPGGARAPDGGSQGAPAAPAPPAGGQGPSAANLAAPQATPQAAEVAYGNPDAAFWDNVMPALSPKIAMQRAALLDRRAALEPEAEKEAEAERARAAELYNAKFTTLKSGQRVEVPGALAAEAKERETSSRAEAQGKQDVESAPGTLETAATKAGMVKGAEVGATPTKVVDEDGNAFSVTGTKAQEIAQANSEGKPATINGKKIFDPDAPQVKAMEQNAQKYQEEDRTFNTNYAKNREMLTSLAPIYQAWKSGRGGSEIANLSSWAQRFGLQGALPQGWQTAPAGFDSAIKVATMQAFGVLQDTPGLQRAPRTGLQETLLTSARPDADPTAAWNIITHGLAALDYNRDMHNYVNKNISGINVNKAVDEFSNKTPFDPYLEKARKEIPPSFQGITPDSYHTVTGAKLKRSPTGEIGDPQRGFRWDKNGQPVQ